MSWHWLSRWIKPQRQGESVSDWLASLPELPEPKGFREFTAPPRRQAGMVMVHPAIASVAERRTKIVPRAGENIP